jgi:hypothetical protein
MTDDHDDTMDRTLDGNAAAGPLRRVFAVDMVDALCTCGHCGNTAALATHALYADAPALVLRCPGCEGVVLRYAETDNRARLDLSGARLIVIDLA